MPLVTVFLSVEVLLASGCFPEDDLDRYSSAPLSAEGGAAGAPSDASAPSTGGAGASGGGAAGSAPSSAGNGGTPIAAGDASDSGADADEPDASDSGSPSLDASRALADAAP